MGAATQSAVAGDATGSVASSIVVRTRKVLSRAGGLSGPSAERASKDGYPSATELGETLELSFPARIRKFVWLSSGLFSAASFTMPAFGILALGAIPTEGLGSSFLAGIVSACVFALTSRLRFGPDEA